MVTSYTGVFLDWVKATIIGTGLVQPGEVYDEREKSLEWVISESMESLTGISCLVNLPTLTRDPQADGANEYSVETVVSIRRNVALSPTRDPYAIAENLLAALNCGRFYPNAQDSSNFIPNVHVSRLAHRADKEDSLHTINIQTTIII